MGYENDIPLGATMGSKDGKTYEKFYIDSRLYPNKSFMALSCGLLSKLLGLRRQFGVSTGTYLFETYFEHELEYVD